MAGFGGVWVFLACALTVGSVILCVVYGGVNWNKPVADQGSEIREEAVWEERDPDLNEGGVK